MEDYKVEGICLFKKKCLNQHVFALGKIYNVINPGIERKSLRCSNSCACLHFVYVSVTYVFIYRGILDELPISIKPSPSAPPCEGQNSALQGSTGSSQWICMGQAIRIMIWGIPCSVSFLLPQVWAAMWSQRASDTGAEKQKQSWWSSCVQQSRAQEKRAEMSCNAILGATLLCSGNGNLFLKWVLVATILGWLPF